MPNYSQGGFLVDDQGRINITIAAPSGTSTFVDGLAYDVNGNLHITTTVSGSDVFVSGHRVSISGQLVVAVPAAPLQPYVYNGGWPSGKTNGETVYLLDITPVAADPYLVGIRLGGPSDGVYMATGI